MAGGCLEVSLTLGGAVVVMLVRVGSDQAGAGRGRPDVNWAVGACSGSAQEEGRVVALGWAAWSPLGW